jgi:hypothetical protein
MLVACYTQSEPIRMCILTAYRSIFSYTLDRTTLQVPFLNLMSIVKERAGRVNIRIGGNSQEEAALVQSLADGKIIEKDQATISDPVCRDHLQTMFRAQILLKTETPALLYTPDVFYMLANITALVNTRWYLGESWVVKF